MSLSIGPGRAQRASKGTVGNVALLVVLVVVIATVFIALWLVPSSAPAVIRAPTPEAPTTSANPRATPSAPEDSVETPHALTTRADLGTTVSDPSALLAAGRFEGRARVRGVLHTDPPGLPLPNRWTLTLRPSRVLSGGEHATTRSLEFTNGESRFEIDDLPLGGYELVVDVLPFDSPPQQLLLAAPEATDIFVQLVAHRAGSIDGGVMDASGRGVEELDIVLEALDGARRVVRTERGGRYRFESVPDGTYHLHVGTPESPIVPARELVFSAPHLEMPTISVPELCELRITVLDALGRPVEEADIVGWGKNGGSIHAASDAQGIASARFLPPGEYSVRATHPSHGSNREHVTLVASSANELAIRIAR